MGQIRKELGKRHRGSSSGDRHRSEKRARPSGSRSREPRKDDADRHSSASKREEVEAPAVTDKPSLPEGGEIAEEAIGGSSGGAIEVSPLQIVIVSDDAEETLPVRPAILPPDVLQLPAVESPLRMEEAPAQVEGSEEAAVAAEAQVEPSVERLVEVEVPPVEGLPVTVLGDTVREIEVQVDSARDGAIVEEEEEEEEEESLGERSARAEASLTGAEASEALQARVLMKEAERMVVPQAEAPQAGSSAMSSLVYSSEVDDMLTALIRSVLHVEESSSVGESAAEDIIDVAFGRLGATKDIYLLPEISNATLMRIASNYASRVSYCTEAVILDESV